MTVRVQWFILSLLSCLTISCVAINVIFTNLKCDVLDESFGAVSLCRLKVIRRGVTHLSVTYDPFHLPIDNLTVAFSLWRKTNGYAPFLYKSTIDFCAFMENRKRWPVFNLFTNMIERNVNFNHSCPYNHSLLITNYTIDLSYYNYFPLPTSDYMFMISLKIFGRFRVATRTYLSVVE